MFGDSIQVRCRATAANFTLLSNVTTIVGSKTRNCVKWLQPLPSVCYKTPSDTSYYINPATFFSVQGGVCSVSGCPTCVESGNTLLLRKILNGSTVPVRVAVNYKLTDANGSTTITDSIVVHPNCNPKLFISKIYPINNYGASPIYCQHELPQNVTIRYNYFGITGTKTATFDLINTTTNTTTTAWITTAPFGNVSNTVTSANLSNSLTAGYYKVRINSGALTATAAQTITINPSQYVYGAWQCTTMGGGSSSATTPPPNPPNTASTAPPTPSVATATEVTATEEAILFVPPSPAERTRLTLYPNPTHDRVMIVLPDDWNVEAATPTVLQIIDLQGRVFLNQNVTQSMTEIVLPEGSKGVFFVRITSNGRAATEKLIIE